jgi:hypothetical protein
LKTISLRDPCAVELLDRRDTIQHEQLRPLNVIWSKCGVGGSARARAHDQGRTAVTDAEPQAHHVLHEKVLLVAVTITETPRVADEERVVVTPISDEFTRAELRFGFMEQPDPSGLSSQ